MGKRDKEYWVKFHIHKCASRYFRAADRLAWADEFFSTLDDLGESEFQNALALEMLAEAKDFRQKKSEAGAKGNAKRWSSDQEESQSDSKASQSDSKATSSDRKVSPETETTTETETEAVQLEILEHPAAARIPFDEFWTRYPRKENKKVAKDRFDRLSAENQRKAIDAIEPYVRSKDPKFIAHAATYLSKCIYLDDFAEIQASNARTSRAMSLPDLSKQQAAHQQGAANLTEFMQRNGIEL